MNENMEPSDFTNDDAPFEWTSLSMRTTGLSSAIWVCDIRPIIVVTDRSAILNRSELNRLYDWLRLNQIALQDHWDGNIDTAELTQRLRPLPLP